MGVRIACVCGTSPIPHRTYFRRLTTPYAMVSAVAAMPAANRVTFDSWVHAECTTAVQTSYSDAINRCGLTALVPHYLVTCTHTKRAAACISHTYTRPHSYCRQEAYTCTHANTRPHTHTTNPPQYFDGRAFRNLSRVQQLLEDPTHHGRRHDRHFRGLLPASHSRPHGGR